MKMEILKAQLYLDSVKRIRAADGNKELQRALIDDHIESGDLSTEIIQALLDRNKAIVDILPEIKQLLIWCMDTDAEKDMFEMQEKIEKWEQ